MHIKSLSADLWRAGRIGTLVAVAAATLVAGCSSVAEHSGSETADGSSAGGAAAEPRDTHDTFAGARHYGGRVSLAEAAKASDAVVEATVERIGPTLFNTATGEWAPSAGVSHQELHELWGSVVPYTTIDLRVTTVIGGRAEQRLNATVGATVTVTLLGGAKKITVTPELARAVGITVPKSEGSGEPNQAPDNAVYPAAPFTITRSLGVVPRLAKGDTVVAFLKSAEIPVNMGRSSRPVVISLVPEGLGFYRSDPSDPTRLTNAATGKVESSTEVRRAGASINGLPGAAGRFKIGTY